VKPKPTQANLAGSRYLALQRLARAQKRPTAELLVTPQRISSWVAKLHDGTLTTSVSRIAVHPHYPSRMGPPPVSGTSGSKSGPSTLKWEIPLLVVRLRHAV
jgi:hypothetical protein